MKQEPLEKLIHPDLIPMLERGAIKAELHTALAEIIGADMDSAEVDVARMNTIGTLRAWGYKVEGGRGGGKIYKIVGWEPTAEYRGAEDWDGEEAEMLAWIRGYKKPDWDIVAAKMLSGTLDPFHTRCAEYIRCYELAKGNQAYDFGDLLVLQKFISMPRFRIYDLCSTPEELYWTAEKISKASLGTVEIRGIGLDQAKELKKLDPKGSISRRAEAVYDVEHIAEAPGDYLNKRAMQTLRKLNREMSFYNVGAETMKKDGKRVIENWRDTNERKMRQLAITRDYTSLDCRATFNFIGYRGEYPVCINILDRLPARGEYVALITEKSLNYSRMPGGHPGISDYNIVHACSIMASHGVKYFNAGGYDGGGYGLADHKKTWSSPELDVESITFTTSLPHLSKEKYRV